MTNITAACARFDCRYYGTFHAGPCEPGGRVEDAGMPSDLNAPQVGRWYWVDEKDDHYGRWLGCVVHLGSNYAALEGVSDVNKEWTTKLTTRVLLDGFNETCTYEPNAEAIVKSKIGDHERATKQLMGKVQAITERLAIQTSTQQQLPAGGETQALALRGAGQDINEYKTALVRAKEKQLPQLFKEIEHHNKAMSEWMKATLIPLHANVGALKPAIGAIEARIFNVELYAGLVEEVVQIADGEAAGRDEKVWLFQRRAYMDEECLANYEAGGMEFKNLPSFDRWLVRPDNLNRLLPSPRCIVAFQVRRNRKERAIVSIADFINIVLGGVEKADRLTFLYIRNGDKVFRLNTSIEFGAQLFPDLDRAQLGGKLYAQMFGGDVKRLVTEGEYLDMVREENEQVARNEAVREQNRKLPKDKQEYVSSYISRDSKECVPYSPESVYYDDISAHIKSEIDRHNRLVLVLQGLLDRSPVLHPHPRWQLWTPEGFGAGIHLVYDDSRALTPGEKPDFEAYRARLNASLQAGSVTVGQEEVWERKEAEKENARRDNSWRHRSDYRPERYRPYGNPGPGTLARVLTWSAKKQQATYEWFRDRQTAPRMWTESRGNRLRCTVTADAANLLNVDAYRPGDFKIFFADPRTRAEYLQWAPLLLEAEEFHAGNRKMNDDPKSKHEPTEE